MDKQTDKKRQTRPPSSAVSRPPLPKFSGYVEVEAHHTFHPSTIWVRPLITDLGPITPQKADFAMKQRNICRLSGDIINRRASHFHSVASPSCVPKPLKKITKNISYLLKLNEKYKAVQTLHKKYV